MILVTLGTQDKSFERLLKAIDKQIDNKKIKEKVVVQAGYTKYKSNNMEIFDYCSPEELDKLMKKADLVITHGGVGSILGALKYNKPIIAAARLEKYKEHTNDHQLQIIGEFAKNGHIIELKDFDKLDEKIKEAKKFIPKKYTSNTKNMEKLISNYIEKENHISWYNKFRYIFYTMLLILTGLLIWVIIK